MLKVCTIVGTRPELIKMSRIIAEMDKYTNHLLVHTGQNYDYELNQVFFDDMDIRRPDYFLETAGKNAAATIGQVIEKSDELLAREKPDALLVYGDTNSALCTISAKRLQIPVFHMEAGNRCYDERVPEEINRRIIDHISDINLTLTEHSRRYLMQEGIPGNRIIKVGSNMKEVLKFMQPKIEKSKIISELNLKPGEYFIVSAHREENVDKEHTLRQLYESLKLLTKEFDIPVIISTHPRTKRRLEEFGFEQNDDKIRFLKPFGFSDYIKLQMQAKCVLSDSGTITEEAALLNLKAVTIRQTHERPEGNDAGVLIMSVIKPEKILQAVKIITEQEQSTPNFSKIIADYEVDNASAKMVRIVQSYTDYIKREVWYK